ncbi:putative defensin-like protein 73 [Raphanus sativus]|uniref:Defensin-like protein 73 n=1 Tax=Raphanus sativus TaxID=3726 RepID=A0A6J0P0W1_RAPSA|nr:putative defensin-like protein 73 [Raphanus sativus]
MKTNCKIGFMSFLMIASVLIILLTVPAKVEAEPQCIGLCGMILDCTTACIRMGYHFGQCVGFNDPYQCCCDH